MQEAQEPTTCVLRKDPELIVRAGLKELFELLETFEDESHWWRYLLKCRECGQSYVFEFYEEIDWEGGEDPQFRTWIPVETDEEIKRLRQASPGALRYLPGLHVDHPKGAEKQVYWRET